MTRLQIVTLPTLSVGSVSQPEYLIVLDEVDAELVAELARQPMINIKESTGARGVLVFEGRLDVVHESSVRPTPTQIADAVQARLNRTF